MASVGIHRRIGGLAVFGALLAFALPGPTTAADKRPGFEVLDLVVDQEIYDEICELLGLSDVQREAVRPAFDEYSIAVRALDAATDRRAAEAGANEIPKIFRDARARGEENPARDTVELTQNVRKVWAEGNREADLLLDQFLAKLRAMFQGPDSSDKIAPVERLVRRRNFLVKASDPNAVTCMDFGLPVDMLTVFADASTDGQELAELPYRGGDNSDVPRECKEQCRQLANYFMNYELAVDALIGNVIEDSRTVPPPPTNDGIIREDDVAGANYLRQRRGRHWEFIQVNDVLSTQVQDVARSCLDEKRSARWELRVWRAIAPSVGRTMWLDELIAANRGLEDWDDAQRAEAARIYDAFAQKRFEMQRGAYQQGLATAARHLRVWGTEELQLRFAKRLVAIDQAHHQAIARIRGLMREEQLANFDAARHEAIVAGRNLFDTSMTTDVLKALSLHGVNIQPD